MADNHSARETILATIRGALGRGRLSSDGQKELEQRLKNHKSNLIPARAKGTREVVVARFLEMAEKASCSIQRVQSTDEVPEAVADYLPAQPAQRPGGGADRLARSAALAARAHGQDARWRLEEG